MAPINLVVENEVHRATLGGVGGVKTIGNYAAVSHPWMSFSFVFTFLGLVIRIFLMFIVIGLLHLA